MTHDHIADAITAHYGPRCPDTEPGCPCCDALIALRWRMCRDFALRLAVLDKDIRRETRGTTND